MSHKFECVIAAELERTQHKANAAKLMCVHERYASKINPAPPSYQKRYLASCISITFNESVRTGYECVGE